MDKKRKLSKIMPSIQLVFSLSVLGLYLALWHVAPEKTIVALRSSIDILFHVLLPLGMVFLIMIGLNAFLKPVDLAKLLGKGTAIPRNLFSAAAGIISAGPIYAWYPMLKDFREKGAEHSLVAVFLVNRAVKPFLLPMMVSFFGWTYVLAFTFLTIAGSLCVGFVVGTFLDSPKSSRQNDKD
jgi:uncharacterized membrane protein YraQ (UPF0718 family)